MSAECYAGFSIHELPQVLNVLGEDEPRRAAAAAGAGLPPAQAWHRKRYNVLPGITGLSQISGRSSLTFDDLVRLDFYYIENWSISLDISILVKTMPAVFARRGVMSGQHEHPRERDAASREDPEGPLRDPTLASVHRSGLTAPSHPVPMLLGTR